MPNDTALDAAFAELMEVEKIQRRVKGTAQERLVETLWLRADAHLQAAQQEAYNQLLETP